MHNKHIDADLVELAVNCVAFSGCVHKAGHAHRYGAKEIRRDDHNFEVPDPQKHFGQEKD